MIAVLGLMRLMCGAHRSEPDNMTSITNALHREPTLLADVRIVTPPTCEASRLRSLLRDLFVEEKP